MNNDGLQQPTQFSPEHANFIAPPPPEKPHKGLIVLSIILGVLLLGAIGVIVYFLFFQPKNTTQQAAANTTQQTNESKAYVLAQTVSKSVNEQLKPTYPNLVIAQGTEAPAYTVSGANYAVSSDSLGASLTITTDARYDQTGQVAVERAIKEVLDGQTTLTAQSTNWQRTYQNNELVCSYSLGSSPVTLRCADTANYTALSKQLTPFAKAYFASTEGKQNKTGVVFSNPIISKKATSYSNAVINISSTQSPIGGFAGLFYAKDANWTYWRGTQSILSCSAYNTNDLQRAFEGDACYGTGNAVRVVKVGA